MSYNVAVVGATGNVGREMLNILEEREFPVDEIHAIASRNSIGVEVSFGDRTLKCEDLEQFDFSQGRHRADDGGRRRLEGMVAEDRRRRPVVIDNSSAWRMDPDVPLIVPEVNPDAVWDARKKNIIANPNCSTVQLVVALKPLHDRRGSSGWWSRPTSRSPAPARRRWTSCGTRPRTSSSWAPPSPRVPQADRLQRHPVRRQLTDDGYTDEEAKMWNETHKMLDPDIALTVTCVRVPVFVGHSESVNIEFETPLEPDEARDILRDAPGRGRHR